MDIFFHKNDIVMQRRKSKRNLSLFIQMSMRWQEVNTWDLDQCVQSPANLGTMQ